MADPETHRGARELHPGDLLPAAASADFAVEWLVLELEARRVRVVAADTCPLVGSADWAVPAAEAVAPLVLRLGHVTWAAITSFDPAHRSGQLSAVSLARARHELAVHAAGARRSLLAEEVDQDPEYQDWLASQVAPAVAALRAANEAAGTSVKVSPDQRPRRQGVAPAWRVAAAALLVAALGAGWWGRELGRENAALRSELGAPKIVGESFTLELGAVPRGTPTEVSLGARSHVAIQVVFNQALLTHRDPLRLRLLDAHGALLIEQAIGPIAQQEGTPILLLSREQWAAGPIMLQLVNAKTGAVLSESELIPARD